MTHFDPSGILTGFLKFLLWEIIWVLDILELPILAIEYEILEL